MEFYTYSFEKLDVWKDSRELVKMIYLLTKNYPSSELYGLSSQIRRASVSISANITEGSGRIHIKEQAHFYQIAYSSAIELLNELILSNDLNYIKHEELNQARVLIEKITRQIAQLRKSINMIK